MKSSVHFPYLPGFVDYLFISGCTLPGRALSTNPVLSELRINRTNRSRWPRLVRSVTSLPSVGTSLQSLYKVQLQYKWGQFKIYKLLLPTVRKKGKCKLETGARKFFLPEIGSIKTVYGRILFWWSYQAEVSHYSSLSAYQNVISQELIVDSWQSISVSKFPTVLYSPAPVGAKNAEQSHYQVV